MKRKIWCEDEEEENLQKDAIEETIDLDGFHILNPNLRLEDIQFDTQSNDVGEEERTVYWTSDLFLPIWEYVDKSSNYASDNIMPFLRSCDRTPMFWQGKVNTNPVLAYSYYTDRVIPFKNMKNKITIEVSGMGAGKTTAIIDYLVKRLRIEPTLTIRVIAPRITLVDFWIPTFNKKAINQLVGLKMEHYNDPNINLSNVNLLCIQINSLHRILKKDGTVPESDILVLDEMQSIYQMFSFKGWTCRVLGAEYLRDMILKSKRTIVADALFTQDCLTLFFELIKGSTARVEIRNNTRKMDINKYFVLPNKQMAYEKINEKVKENKNFIVFTTSIQQSRIVKAYIGVLNQDYKVLLINSETTEEDMVFARDVKKWFNYNVAIFTGTITVGVSCDGDIDGEWYFDCLIGIGMQMSGTYNDFTQQTRRVRNTISNEVWVCLPTDSKSGFILDDKKIEDLCVEKYSRSFKAVEKMEDKQIGFAYTGYFTSHYWNDFLKSRPFIMIETYNLKINRMSIQKYTSLYLTNIKLSIASEDNIEIVEPKKTEGFGYKKIKDEINNEIAKNIFKADDITEDQYKKIKKARMTRDQLFETKKHFFKKRLCTTTPTEEFIRKWHTKIYQALAFYGMFIASDITLLKDAKAIFTKENCQCVLFVETVYEQRSIIIEFLSLFGLDCNQPWLFSFNKTTFDYNNIKNKADKLLKSLVLATKRIALPSVFNKPNTVNQLRKLFGFMNLNIKTIDKKTYFLDKQEIHEMLQICKTMTQTSEEKSKLTNMIRSLLTILNTMI